MSLKVFFEEKERPSCNPQPPTPQIPNPIVYPLSHNLDGLEVGEEVMSLEVFFNEQEGRGGPERVVARLSNLRTKAYTHTLTLTHSHTHSPTHTHTHMITLTLTLTH